MTKNNSYAYVFIARKKSSQEVDVFEDLEVAKKSKDTDRENFVDWVGNIDKEKGSLWCMDSPKDEEWLIYKTAIVSGLRNNFCIDVISRISSEVIKLLLVRYPTCKDIRAGQYYEGEENGWTLKICLEQTYHVSHGFIIHRVEQHQFVDNFVEITAQNIYNQFVVYFNKVGRVY